MATRATTVQISMPQMGESVTEGTVLDWLKQVGDRVEADEPLVEVSTDKVDAEVPAPASGTLTKILAEPDATVAVGAVLGEIEVGGRRAAAPAADRRRRRPQTSSSTCCFPEMGDSVAEGTVLEWRVAVGRRGRRRRPARRDLDRQGRRRGAGAGGRDDRRDPGRARLDGRRRRGALPHRRRRRARPPRPAQPPRRAGARPPPAPAAGNGDANATPVAARMASAARARRRARSRAAARAGG